MKSQQRVLEYGESVDLADREMDGEGGGWNQPAAVSCGGNGVVTIEKGQSHT